MYKLKNDLIDFFCFKEGLVHSIVYDKKPLSFKPVLLLLTWQIRGNGFSSPPLLGYALPTETSMSKHAVQLYQTKTVRQAVWTDYYEKIKTNEWFLIYF